MFVGLVSRLKEKIGNLNSEKSDLKYRKFFILLYSSMFSFEQYLKIRGSDYRFNF